MKKITLLLVFLLTIFSGGYAQCIRTNAFGNIVSNNAGLPQTITTCAYTSAEFSVVSGLLVGGNYLFTGQTGTIPGVGTHNYLTITDVANNVLMMGFSPLTFSSITNETVRIHYAIDAACTGAAACNNATVTAILTCPVPSGALVDAISNTTADFTWTLGGSETEWEVLILPNANPAPNPTTSGVPVSGTSAYSASSLISSTAYKFYVRAVCGASDFSPWVLGASFATSCTAYSSLPWEENFDTTATGTNIFPPCWDFSNTLSTWTIETFPTAYSGANSLSRTWSTDGWAFTPLITMTAGTSYTLSYFMRTNDTIVGYDITVGIGNGQTEADMAETLSTVTAYQGPTWTKFTFPYTPTTTGDFSFGIHVVAPNPPNGINFDDFKIDLTPSCVEPTELVASDVTSSTGTVSWTESITTASGGYQYYISEEATAPDAGTTPTGIVAAGVLTNTFTGLTPATLYYVWVRSACSGAEISEWSIGINFQTTCEPYASLPWEENFDTTATGTNVFPPCWGFSNTLSNWSIATNPVAYSGANSLRRTWSTNGWAFTPLVTMTAGTSYTLSYYMRTNDTTVGYDITVGIGNGQTEGDMAETLSTVTDYQGPTWTKFTFSYTPSTTGDFSFGIHVIAPFAPNGINFDNFKIDLTPSCVEPTELVATNVNETTASVSWTESITTASGGYEYYISEDATAPDAGTTPTGFVLAGILTYDFTALTSNTTYNVWVRSACGVADFSEWSSKVMFKTLCASATDLFENFDASTNIPDCWTVVGTQGNVSINGFSTPFSAPNVMSLGSFSSTASTVALPTLSNTAAGTHQLKLKARSQYTFNIGGIIEVGYLTDINDDTSFVMLQSFPTTSGTVYDSFTANLGTDPQSQILAIRNPGTVGSGVVIDDVSWAPVPTTAPECATATAIPDVACGNFATVLTWESVAGADGYNLTIGTTAGGTDIINNEPIGDVNTYSYVGSFNTTYFYTITPFNGFGNAINCVEQSFSTFVDGCYCTSNPTSVDNDGITNVQLGTTNFPNGPVVYSDYTNTTVDLAQGLSANLQVSFATGYTYDTNVWIDFNNDLNFDDSEIVISGISSSTNPTLLNLTFTMPADATLGVHRMRLGSADSGQATPNPCYSGSWGVTIDFSVNIIISTCTPPSAASSTVVDDCPNNQYFVAVDIDGLGNGTPSITNGISNFPVTAIGTIQVGPFVSGTSTTLVLAHGSETICNIPLGVFNSVCPPANDECANATPMVITGDFVSSAVVWNNTGGTVNASNPIPTCGTTGFATNGKDVWFQSTAPASGSVTVETRGNGGLTDTVLSVYTGDCDNLALAACDDEGGTASFSLYSFTGLTPGQPLYIRLWGWNGAAGSALVGCYDASLASTNAFDNKNFTFYPNPVKDVLNLSYTKNISNVSVFNLLGQQIATKVVNANQSKIDMSHLAAGTYMVKVTSDNQVKTIKVIKE